MSINSSIFLILFTVLFVMDFVTTEKGQVPLPVVALETCLGGRGHPHNFQKISLNCDLSFKIWIIDRCNMVITDKLNSLLNLF